MKSPLKSSSSSSSSQPLRSSEHHNQRHYNNHHHGHHYHNRLLFRQHDHLRRHVIANHLRRIYNALIRCQQFANPNSLAQYDAGRWESDHILSHPPRLAMHESVHHFVNHKQFSDDANHDKMFCGVDRNACGTSGNRSRFGDIGANAVHQIGAQGSSNDVIQLIDFQKSSRPLSSAPRLSSCGSMATDLLLGNENNESYNSSSQKEFTAFFSCKNGNDDRTNERCTITATAASRNDDDNDCPEEDGDVFMGRGAFHTIKTNPQGTEKVGMKAPINSATFESRKDDIESSGSLQSDFNEFISERELLLKRKKSNSTLTSSSSCNSNNINKGSCNVRRSDSNSSRRKESSLGQSTVPLLPKSTQQNLQNTQKNCIKEHCSVDMTRKRFVTGSSSASSFDADRSQQLLQSRQQRFKTSAGISTFATTLKSRQLNSIDSSTKVSRTSLTEPPAKIDSTRASEAVTIIDDEPAPNRFGFRLGKRKMLTDKRRFISNCCLACAMFGIAGMILETELTMAKVYDKSSVYSYVVKSSVTASTVLLLHLILNYYRLQAQLYIVNNSLDDWKVALSWPMVLQATTELVICSIHPFPGDVRFAWKFVGMKEDSGNNDSGSRDDDDDGGGGGGNGDDYLYHRHHRVYESEEMIRRDGEAREINDGVYASSSEESSVEVSIDLLFTFPMFLRFYLIGRVMLLQSRILSDASAVSIGALNRISFNVRFVLKALMTICPGTVLVVFMMTVWILTSWTLRVCEGYHDVKHRNFLNSLYMIAITFLSVGYGDFVPSTYCGRAVAVFTGVMGSGCTALVVAVFARKMELTRAEKHVHNFMIDNQLSKKLKHVAANVLRETWFIYKYTSLSSRLDPFKIRCHQRKFLHAIHDLRDIRSKLRTLSDNANTMMDVSRHLTHSALNTTPTVYSSQPPAVYLQMQVQLSDAVTELRERQDSTEEKTNTIETTIAWMQTYLETLPSLVFEQLSVDTFISACEPNLDTDWASISMATGDQPQNNQQNTFLLPSNLQTPNLTSET